MGTTRIKVIDLSSDQKEIKTSRKHAEKLTGVAKIKKEPKETGRDLELQAPKTQIQPESQVVEIEAERPKQPSKLPKTKTPKTSARETHHLSKKYRDAKKLIDSNRLYPPSDALELLPKTSFTKFDPTVEVHLNVADKTIHPRVNFPHPIGAKKEKRYLVFSDQQPAGSSKTKRASGGNNQQIIWADEQTISQIENGTIKPGRDFDTVIAHPKYMTQLAKVAKILGPKGMMPNPKNGTITEDYKTAFSENADHSHELKMDPSSPIIHTIIGKLSAGPVNLHENLAALVSSVGANKIRKATLTSTMGPAIRIDTSALISYPK